MKKGAKTEQDKAKSGRETGFRCSAAHMFFLDLILHCGNIFDKIMVKKRGIA
jgi:hypothetical protein